jgi:hypothetical protein
MDVHPIKNGIFIGIDPYPFYHETVPCLRILKGVPWSEQPKPEATPVADVSPHLALFSIRENLAMEEQCHRDSYGFLLGYTYIYIIYHIYPHIYIYI